MLVVDTAPPGPPSASFTLQLRAGAVTEVLLDGAPAPFTTKDGLVTVVHLY